MRMKKLKQNGSNIPVKQSSRKILIVNPETEPFFLQRFEDRFLRKSFDQLLGIVTSQSKRRRRVHKQPIRLRRCRHRREPPVTHSELGDQLFKHRHRLRLESVHHRGGHSFLDSLGVLCEALHSRLRQGMEIFGPRLSENLLVNVLD